MGRYRNEILINSEQEDLVGSSSSELDEDAEDQDELEMSENEAIQFHLCKTSQSISLIDSASDWNLSAHEYQSLQQRQEDQIKHFQKCKRTFLILILLGFGLLFSSMSLFIILPLYQKQLELSSTTNNIYGSVLFISPIITFLFVDAACIVSWLSKWNKKLIFRIPIPFQRLIVASLCCGIAGTLCTISSYRRIPCHLQDPLKGAALVYSLVFYFFFCKKVMGLQKIFSATTAVVGLFISVDYGLCDEFRCHGNDLSSIKSTIKETTTLNWEGRVFWTLTYVTGIVLWTLHLSLLEGNLVVSSNNQSTQQPNNLLKTISRLVSSTDRLPERHSERNKQQTKQKPSPIHLAMWIHLISTIIMIPLCLTDIIPELNKGISTSNYWRNVGNTFVCHFGISLVENKSKSTASLEYLLNLTPDSILFNQTLKKLHRNRRNLENHRFKYFHRRIGHHNSESLHMYPHTESGYQGLHQNLNKYKNSTTTPLISYLIHSSSEYEGLPNCKLLTSYAWIFILIYFSFIVCTFYFLDITESAVFTITIITTALPLIGLFWSLFRLSIDGSKALIIWSPSISGELICSLLGSPIVILGLVLLYRAHFSDIVCPSDRYSSTSSKNAYRNLRNA